MPMNHGPSDEKDKTRYTEACNIYWHQDEQNQVNFPGGQWTYAKLHLSKVQEIKKKEDIWESLPFTVTGFKKK